MQIWGNALVFPKFASSLHLPPPLFIDNGQKGLRCDAMRCDAMKPCPFRRSLNAPSSRGLYWKCCDQKSEEFLEAQVKAPEKGDKAPSVPTGRSRKRLKALPTPAPRSILRWLKAGDAVYQTLLVPKPCSP